MLTRFLGRRLVLLRQLRVLPAWATSATTAVMLAKAFMPALTALATGSLIGHLVTAAARGDAGLGDVTSSLAVFAALLAVAQIVDMAGDVLRYAVVRRLDRAHRRAVEQEACAPPGTAHLEDPAYQDELDLAAGDPDNWTEGTPGPSAWAQLLVLSRYVAGAAAAWIVARDSVPIAVLLVVSLLAFRYFQRRGFLAVVRTWADGMTHRRRAEYWASLMTGSAAAKEVRVFALSRWIQERHRADSNAHLQPFREIKRRDLHHQWTWLAVVTLAMGAAVYELGDLAVDGRISVGRLGADLTAAVMLLPAFSITETVLELENGFPRLLALRRLRTLAPPQAALEQSVAEPAAGASDANTPPLVRFEGVHFAYPRSEREVLHGLDLEIRPREVLALVGLNGAGKTTIIKLLASLYEPDQGRLTADGVDVRRLGPDAWRRRLAVVFQDFLRCELSARDSIALGRAGSATDDDVRDAARLAGIDALIEGLPQGWDTPLTPGRKGGVDLSGGQWQRVALARALLAVRAGARLLVLDEPTAHLDVKSEFEVFHQVIAAARDASVVLISHRLSTVREADRIVLIEGGRVVEEGAHDALLARDGEYARLFRLQARQFQQGNADGEDAS
jgi:ATP-binding cassette subfamily B protein